MSTDSHYRPLKTKQSVSREQDKKNKKEEEQVAFLLKVWEEMQTAGRKSAKESVGMYVTDFSAMIIMLWTFNRKMRNTSENECAKIFFFNGYYLIRINNSN